MGHEGLDSGLVAASEELVQRFAALRRTRMKGIYTKEIDGRLALGGVAWLGKAALFCLGLVAMAALVVVMSVLTVVLLIATALPAPAVWHGPELRGRRDSTNASEISAPREKAVAS